MFLAPFSYVTNQRLCFSAPHGNLTVQQLPVYVIHIVINIVLKVNMFFMLFYDTLWDIAAKIIISQTSSPGLACVLSRLILSALLQNPDAAS